MTQKSGGAPLTDEQIHRAVLVAQWKEETREESRLGAEWKAGRIEIDDFMSKIPPADLEKIVALNTVSGTKSLAKAEWLSTEATMPPEEKQTHLNLRKWMQDHADKRGIKEVEDDDDEVDDEVMGMLDGDAGDDDDDDDAEDEPADGGAAPKAGAKAAAKAAAPEKQKEERNWSAVNLSFQDSKLPFKGGFSANAFTNWMWWRVIRPKLKETKAKMEDVDDNPTYGLEDIEGVLGEYAPKVKEEKEKKSKDKDKDEKKEKKGKDDKKDDKKEKKGKDEKEVKKKKKDAVTLNTEGKAKAKHCVQNMILGQEKNRGWLSWIDEKSIDRIPVSTPWEFQLAHVIFKCMSLEYQTKKKKETPDLALYNQYYEMVQALADAISLIRKQYKHEFPNVKESDILPLQDALAIQARFRDGSAHEKLKFDLLRYLKTGAHLISGSSFMKRHQTSVFKPFGIQEKMVVAICEPGPQCVFGIAPPGTGKTAVVCHLLSLFPGHQLVFCCAALPVVLGVGRISNSLGVPFAFVKGRQITPSYSCGKGLGHFADGQRDSMDQPFKDAVASLKYKVVMENMMRKKKRLATTKRKRSMFDLKKNPKIFLMCDVASCAWLLRQLDPMRTILVIDEPPMGSDVYHETPSDGPLSCAMIQSMLTTPYKTIWMSATLPRVDALPTLVNNFLTRYKISPDQKSAHLQECFSTELDRGALMCGPSGAVAFPHQKVRTATDLKKLCERLPGDPLVLKAYTERALASLIEKWQMLNENGKMDAFNKGILAPSDKFRDLSDLNHASIRAYAMELLSHVAAQGDDDLVISFCEPSAGDTKPFPEFNLNEILFSNAWAYPGLTLVANDDPSGQLLLMSARLMEHFPTVDQLEDALAQQEAQVQKQKKYEDDDEAARDDGSKSITLKFNPELVIQSEQFLKKWCVVPPGTHVDMRFAPTVGEFKAIKELPVEEKWQMLGLSGAAAFDPKLNSDPGDPVYTQWVHEQMTLKRLACVTAGKEFTWGANVPASTVIVTKSFAETTSVAGMLQYVGRAARRGLTTHGQAVFERDEDLDRIFSTPDGLSTEAVTMERFAKWWLSEGATW